MKISDLLKLSTDNLRRRKGRTALTVIGVVVGTCAIIVMISLGIAQNQRTDAMLESWSDLTLITVYNYTQSADTPALDDKMVAQFQGMENVVAATPMYQFQNMNGQLYAGKNDRYSAYLDATGMDVSAIESMGIELVSGSYLSGQQLGKNKIPVMVGEQAAFNFEDTKKSYRNPNRYRWAETDENGNILNEPFFDITKDPLTLRMIYDYDEQGNPKTRDYQLVVVGVVKTDYSKQGTTGILMNIEDMKRLEEEYKKLSKGNSSGGGTVIIGGSGSQKVGGYNQVYVKVDDVDHVADVESVIKEIGYETNSMSQYREDMQKQVASGQMMLGGLAAVSLLVAALNIANTMTMAIYERTKEIGVMKVLGCKLSKIRQMFLIEAGFIGLLGGIAGAALSLLLSLVLNNINTWLQALAMFLSQFGIVMQITNVDIGALFGMGGMGDMGGALSVIPLWLILLALLFATVVGVLSGIAPANRAVKISALEAIRHE